MKYIIAMVLLVTPVYAQQAGGPLQGSGSSGSTATGDKLENTDVRIYRTASRVWTIDDLTGGAVKFGAPDSINLYVGGITASSDIAAGKAIFQAQSAFPTATVNTAGADLVLAGGQGIHKFTVTDWTLLVSNSGSLLRIAPNKAGSVTLNRAQHWVAATSNAVTASNIATVINAHGTLSQYVTAAASGDDVWLTPKANCYSLVITANTTQSPGLTATSGTPGMVHFAPRSDHSDFGGFVIEDSGIRSGGSSYDLVCFNFFGDLGIAPRAVGSPFGSNLNLFASDYTTLAADPGTAGASQTLRIFSRSDGGLHNGVLGYNADLILGTQTSHPITFKTGDVARWTINTNSLISGTALSADTATTSGNVKGQDAYPQATTNTSGSDLVLAGGIGRRFITVVTFGSLAGKTVTIGVNATSVTLTEGVNWTAATSNAATATSLGAAITANGTLGAQLTVSVVSDKVYLTPKSTCYQSTMYTNAGAPMTVTLGADGIPTIANSAGPFGEQVLKFNGGGASMQPDLYLWNSYGELAVHQSTALGAGNPAIVLYADVFPSTSTYAELAYNSWVPNEFDITTSNALTIWTGSSAPLTLGTNGTARWRLDTSGHFTAVTDNTLDIGASGATRPRSIYVGTNVVLPTGGLKFAAGSTGSTTNTLGTNGPNVTATPNTWVTVTLSDGSTGYMPIWK